MLRLNRLLPLVFGLLFGSLGPCAAEVVRLEITSKESYGTFQPGEYVQWKGRVCVNSPPPNRSPISTRPRATNAARWSMPPISCC